MDDFKKIFMASPSPMTLSLLETGEMVEVNQSFCDLTGFKREEVLGKTGGELRILSEEDREKLLAAQEEEGLFRSLEISVETREGPKSALVSGGVIELSSGPHLLLIGTSTELQKAREEGLTEVHAALEEAQAVESKFRVIFDQSVELMGILALDGTVQDVNRVALDMVGERKEDLVGKPFWDTPWWNHSSELQDRLKGWMARAARGETVVLEADHPYVEGGWRRVEAVIAPIRDPNGAPRFLVAVGHDITDRVRAERALKESEERYESLVSNIPDVTWITSQDGHTSFISPNAEGVLGFSPQELCDAGENLWFQCLHPADRDRVIQAFTALFTEGREFKEEYRFRRKDGTWIWLRDRAVRTFEAEGISHAYGVFSDITEQRALQAQLHQAQKLDTLGTLASGIAHDFNNLLVPILGYADLLREGVPGDDPLRIELESHLFDASERARDLVQQILTFSREHEAEKKPIHPEGPVKNALRLVSATLPASVRLRRFFAPDVGRVLGDGAQLQQVVVNFCTNAIHAMRKKGGILSVKLSPWDVTEDFRERNPKFPGDRAVLMEFADTGEGMDRDVLERVFDPFFTTKKVGEGTGLGLSIVYGIIGSHGGVVEAKSQLGEGTTFTVFLPEVRQEEAEGEKEAGGQAGGGEHVLFVDDQAAIRDTGFRLLKHLGYTVTPASGAEEALQLFQENPDAFDVLVTDYDMPRMTGIHLALDLMEIKPGLPVVLITGSHTAQAKEAESVGIRSYLLKPFTASDLGTAIRNSVEVRPEEGEEG